MAFGKDVFMSPIIGMLFGFLIILVPYVLAIYVLYSLAKVLHWYIKHNQIKWR